MSPTTQTSAPAKAHSQPPSLTALSAILPPPPPAGVRRYRLVATVGDVSLAAEVSRGHLRRAVGSALRWLRRHYPHTPWQLVCRTYPHSSHRAALEIGRWNHADLPAADGKAFTWLSQAARHPSETTLAGGPGLERPWPHRHVLRARL